MYYTYNIDICPGWVHGLHNLLRKFVQRKRDEKSWKWVQHLKMLCNL